MCQTINVYLKDGIYKVVCRLVNIITFIVVLNGRELSSIFTICNFLLSYYFLEDIHSWRW